MSIKHVLPADIRLDAKRAKLSKKFQHCQEDGALKKPAPELERFARYLSSSALLSSNALLCLDSGWCSRGCRDFPPKVAGTMPCFNVHT